MTKKEFDINLIPITYKHIFETGFHNDLQAHVSKHILRFLKAERDTAVIFDMTVTFKALRTLRKHEAMQVVKTWCNSWATSKRLHLLPLLPCVFGCSNQIDDLSH